MTHVKKTTAAIATTKTANDKAITHDNSIPPTPAVELPQQGREKTTEKSEGKTKTAITEKKTAEKASSTIKKTTLKDSATTNAQSTPTVPAARKRRRKNRPGQLTGAVPFEMHTNYAQWLFMGGSTDDAVSLLRFGGQMSVIWNAAKEDDPYADWMLLKVYDGMIKLRNQLAVAIQDTQEKLRTQYDFATLAFTPFVSQKPIVQSLWFRTPYGYLGAQLIADFDQLMRLVLTAERVGVLLEQSHTDTHEQWLKRIAPLLKQPFTWQRFAITRADIEAKNEKAQVAEKAMGTLPQKILNKTLRAPFAPSIITTPSPKQEENALSKDK